MKFTRKQKAQVSIETLFSVGVLLLVLAIITFAMFQRQQDIRDIERYVEEKTACDKVATIITEVFVLGEGTQFTTLLDYDMEFLGSNLTEGNTQVITVLDDLEVPCTIPHGKITNGTSIYFQLPQGRTNFTNVGDLVLIEPEGGWT